MLTIQENVSLKPFNTFQVDVRARYFCEVVTQNDLLELVKRLAEFPKFMVLGGGSNVLFCGNYDGLIIHNKIAGRQFIECGEAVDLVLGGGENWHQSVLAAVDKNLYGIENLSLIPGTVGAAPIQNIGAYGVELKDVFKSLTAINLANGEQETFDLNRCAFGYRDSVFKRAAAGQYCITQVILQLNKNGLIQSSYGEIEAELDKLNLKAEQLTPADMSKVICHIRQRKLPDPDHLPNAGSFFKNPIVSASQYEKLKAAFPDLVSYPVNGQYKLACGWMIDRLGWKGKSCDGAKVHDHQALVLINTGGGADAICELARQIQTDVFNAFGVQLEPEPLWVA